MINKTLNVTDRELARALLRNAYMSDVSSHVGADQTTVFGTSITANYDAKAHVVNVTYYGQSEHELASWLGFDTTSEMHALESAGNE